MKDFIADDDEVEYGDEEEGTSEAAVKQEGDEARKKKKRKHRRPRELDEEDFDLIQQNTGLEVKKKKRLQRVADQEGQENKAPIDSDHDESRLKVKKDEDAELFESEAGDSTSRKRLITSATRRGIQESTNMVD